MRQYCNLLAGILLAFWFSGCATLPPRPETAHEPALPPPAATPLAEVSQQFIEDHGETSSGFRLLLDARQAMLDRLALIDKAERSLDIQIFIWDGDAAGTLLFHRALLAADRGVRVRIIADDMGITAGNRDLVAMNTHPNLEIRVFNPNPSRDSTFGSMLEMLGSFKELNRRMHNKLMIVDNLAVIAGGRNIGNQYFGLGKKYNFFDIDVLALGAVVSEASMAFDHYWNHNAAYPFSKWTDLLPDNTLEEVEQEILTKLASYSEEIAVFTEKISDWSAWYDELGASLVPGEAHFLQDDPVPIDGREYRLVDMISYLTDPATDEFLLSTPYLLPVGTFFEDIEAAHAKGIRIRFLTNSMASTNHTIVNSHYKKYRVPILEVGAELHELNYQPDPLVRDRADVAPHRAGFISLHAKVFVVDRRVCFIGSLNFDPRALVINTENGLLIESPELAEQLTDKLEILLLPENSWQVAMDENGSLRWISADKTVTRQPARSGGQRITDFFGRLLPIEDQL
jgi:putative cardiolipin synthase